MSICLSFTIETKQAFAKMCAEDEGNVEQFNGREGETATFLSRSLVIFGGLGGGFAPRHLSRSAFRGKFVVAIN